MNVRKVSPVTQAVVYTGEFKDYLDILNMMRSSTLGAKCTLSMWERDKRIFVLDAGGNRVGSFDKGDHVILEQNDVYLGPLRIIDEDTFKEYYETL